MAECTLPAVTSKAWTFCNVFVKPMSFSCYSTAGQTEDCISTKVHLTCSWTWNLSPVGRVSAGAPLPSVPLPNAVNRLFPAAKGLKLVPTCPPGPNLFLNTSEVPAPLHSLPSTPSNTSQFIQDGLSSKTRVMQCK